MLALARKVVAGEEDANSVESVFAQAQQVAAEAEALLVDAEWAGPEPVPVEVPVSQHDAPKTQRSLFSWAEFMAEKPAKPVRRQGKRSDSLPLFELAVSLEREAELVGAGP